MLKLLKYDFASIRKIWVIGLIVALLMSVGGGLFLNSMIHSLIGLGADLETLEKFAAETDETQLEKYLQDGFGTDGEDTDEATEEEVKVGTILSAFFSYLGWLLCLGAMSAFVLFSAILVCLRYYRHFYGDEGYLTFMLPLSRNTLLHEKILFGVGMYFLSGLFLTGMFVLMIWVSMWGNPLASAVFRIAWMVMKHLFLQESGIPVVLKCIGGVLFALLSAVEVILVGYFCITLGASLAQRKKVLAAIGFYAAYVALSELVVLVPVMIRIFGSLSDFLEEETVRVWLNVSDMTDLMVGIETVYLLAWAMVSYFVIRKLNRRKLNLT